MMKRQQISQGWMQRFLLWGAICVALVFMALFAASSPFSAHAATTVPTKMNFQGRITNSAGNILADGTYNMRFKIWDSLSGGSSVWSEDRLVSAAQGVTVTNGQFSVQLGEITSLPASVFSSNSRYFEIELPTPGTATSSSPTWTEGAMTPRNQLVTSAYAYNAETLDGIDGASFAQLGANNAFTGTNSVDVSNANAFQVKSGSTNLFNANTANSIVTIGTSDTTGAVLVLDVKTDAGDPAGGSATNGAMYYNSNANKFRCYQNGAWKDCDTSGGTIASGNTAGRPGSPSEGDQYLDTDIDRLLVYSNGKWQADRTDAIIVASSTSSQTDRDAADYVTDGNTGAANDGDQIEINTALTAASGRKVVLLAGTYTVDASVQIPNNTTLTGVGNGTLIQLATINATDDIVETTGTGKTGQILRDLRIDGGTNASGTQRGISILNTDNMRINGVTVSNMRNDGLYTNTSTNLTITDSTFKDNDDRGIYLDSSTENVMFENNIVTGSVNAGLLTYSVYGVTINDNVFDNNPTDAVVLNVSSSVIVSNNSITDNSWGIAVVDSNDIIVSANSLLNNTAGDAIHLTNSNRVSLTDNRLHNNGAGTAGSGIKISNSDDAYVTGNSITDTAGTGYAIDIDVSTSDRTYLSNNVYSGTGASSINDSGTNTRYGGQTNGSGNYLIQPAGTIELMKNTNVTGTLDVSSSVDAVSGYSFNGTSGSTVTCSGGQVMQNQVVQGGIITGGSCTTAGGTPTLQDVYDNDASGTADITTTSSAKTFLFKAGSGFDAAALFDIQDAGGLSMFTVDSSNDRVYIGDSTADGVGVELVLDTKNTAGDPTGVDGAMYYNSDTKNFRCRHNGIWQDCDFASLRAEWVLQEDFSTGTVTAGTGADLGNIGDSLWTFVSIGTGGTLGKVNVGTDASNRDRFGVLQMNSPATVTTGVHLRRDNTSMAGVPSNMTVEFDFGPVNTAAANGTQTVTRIGLHDSTNSAAPTDGIYFQYSTTTTAGNWFRCTQTTCVDTGVARTTTANTYQRFRIQTNSAGTSVEFFIDEASVGTASTNLPGSTASYGPAINTSTVDATIRQWKIDYFQIKRNLTTLR
ncbi:MAG TPA: right-handed parallel beta-helix repeat-containing protein [Candidatus Saccharibacteria bacterium]|nr:right-handed parallel beta-helix repeat-containing protein [Candidatus Saccharibacteria bacterium]HRK94096.1 right-handed parallel beta-helix repeat-containing protein [Candidatus Saccharibacteria bacterium]